MKRALLLLLASCAHHVDAQWAYRDGAPALEKGDHVSAKQLARAAEARLPNLGAARLPSGDVEVRFWIVPSFGPARGVVIRKSGAEFRALVVDASGARDAKPSRSWDSMWEALSSDGILTLPDDSALPSDDTYILDGVTYAVEVQHDGVYRSYSYRNPAEHQWPEATRVLRMAHVLARAFRIRIDDRSPKVRARIPDDDVDASSHAMGAPCDPLDMSQGVRCGANGRVAIEIEHGTSAACDLRPLPAPNEYAIGACVAHGRVYFAATKAVLVGDIAEMTDEQRLYVQKKIGISQTTPLRTIDAWRAALR